MIKGKGAFRKVAGAIHDRELQEALAKLPDNKNYEFVIIDDRANRLLPYLTYLFNVVLKSISDQLPDHPDTEALYRYFEEKLAPPHACTINGEKYEYFNLKGERKNEVVNFVEKIDEYVQKHWGLDPVIRIEELKDAKHRDLHAMVYMNQDVNWSNFLSSRNKQQTALQDERNI